MYASVLFFYMAQMQLILNNQTLKLIIETRNWNLKPESYSINHNYVHVKIEIY
jgi:hypothetical protein